MEDRKEARALNELARHQAITRLYAEILIDMQVCEIEGWDKTEFIKKIESLISHFTRQLKGNNCTKEKGEENDKRRD